MSSTAASLPNCPTCLLESFMSRLYLAAIVPSGESTHSSSGCRVLCARYEVMSNSTGASPEAATGGALKKRTSWHEKPPTIKMGFMELCESCMQGFIHKMMRVEQQEWKKDN
eukprot:461434-Pelagomonas_calceolata.AAC.15